MKLTPSLIFSSWFSAACGLLLLLLNTRSKLSRSIGELAPFPYLTLFVLILFIASIVAVVLAIIDAKEQANRSEPQPLASATQLRLELLDRMLQARTITEEEYRQQRERILNEV